ncbi:MAG TPA: molybdenum cofactor guanylyltransferase MobA [Hyphomicrobium sp.]|nr:molybdenum cofactor guanylyltransferase MobA [Hyphomicrobium sp.]
MQTGNIGADVTGVLLAGGRSSRMGGREKALLSLGGRPMLQHVADRFGPQVARTVINANGDPARFADFALPVVADSIEGQPGPLAGLLTGIAWARRETPAARFIATVPADCPFLPRDLVARLMAALLEADSPCAIAATAGQRHPVAGLWRMELADAAADALAQNMRALHRFADAQGCAVAAFSPVRIDGAEVDPFFNVNTPGDLERAEALLGKEDIRA